MDLDDYIQQAKRYAVLYVNSGNMDGIELLAQIAHESEEAKQKLRKMGYGYTGLSISKTVDEVINKIVALEIEIETYKRAHAVAIGALSQPPL